MSSHAILVTDHANSDNTANTPEQSAFDRLNQRIEQRQDALRLSLCKCRNCLVCRAEEYNRKTDMRKRRAISRVRMKHPCMITIAPDDPAHPDLGKLIGEAIARLKRSDLCTDSYIWQIEIGKHNGRLHVHAVIDATATVTEIHAALDAWHDNRCEQFCSKHSGINVIAYRTTAEAIGYLFKGDAAPVDTEGWDRLPHRTFGKSRDINLSPRKKRQVPQAAIRRSPNDYSPRTWDNQHCGQRVEVATIKKDTYLVSDAAVIDISWPECLSICNGPETAEKIMLQGTSAVQTLLSLRNATDAAILPEEQCGLTAIPAANPLDQSA